jgi:hypothetical protein
LPVLAWGKSSTLGPEKEMEMQASPTDVQKALSGADYPASRDELIEVARENDAPEELVEELESSLGEEEYESRAEVLAALGDDED